MGFNRDVVRRRRENLKVIGVKIRWVGSRPRLWRSVINELAIAEAMTVGNDVITVNYCVNYGGRAEIAEAAKDIARLVEVGRLDPDRITEATISRHLQRPDIPDVDLFLRTSGEQRSSNFMLWQAAYAEYIFQDKLWPDYDRRDFIAEDLDLVSLTQILAWDLPLTKKISDRIAKHARDSNFGSVTLVEKVNEKAVQRNSGKSAAKTADVMLRYNFPGGGLTDDALRTLILLVLDTGAEIRRSLTG
jgi:hypothetical protein